MLLKLTALGALAPFLASAQGLPLPARRPSRPDDSPAQTPLPLVVLDPGHGGRDPGAISVSGSYEKHIVLDIAQQMARLLEGRARLKLTRENDRFLALPERVAIARDAQANLFISIHADSAPDSAARGLSAYTLSETASDDFSRKLAESENIVDQRYGSTYKGSEAVASILYDLAAHQTITASRFAKDALVRGAGRKMPLLDEPKRSANFAVLRAPDVPSLLIETGFLSNPKDEAILTTSNGRKRIATILAGEISTVLKNPLFS
jgi:N-acetylmuramoyl-L-alanine amidase